ncbi:hypothetical protein CFP56_013192 [Quercus suber]|uniref:Disease resistance protein At4g27190-like leucine-rich repeats domain-containing protein n=1 Tax=Quercus suber TaxID=58331 RepID=A0AAW0KTW3_QUESU
MGFKNLRLLEVSGCKSLTYLFSPSIAKLLVMLEEIRVTSCKKIEEILQRAREEKEEKEVLFHKVNSILLRDLPNLKCFFPETNAFEWPSLKEITREGNYRIESDLGNRNALGHLLPKIAGNPTPP